jgi:DNA-binding transcriptional LysR family regulator
MQTRDLSAFLIFKRVVDLGSFSQAAKAEKMSNNSITLSIQNLERRVGLQLLNRTTKKVWLTEAGKRYYEAYAKVTEELNKARAKVAGKEEKTSTPGGSLSILAPSMVASYLAPALTEFLLKNPGLVASLSCTQTDNLDLVLSFVSSAEDEKIVLSGKRVLVAAVSYLYRAGPPQTLEKLSTHNCLKLVNQEHWKLSGPKGESQFAPKGNLTLDNEETLLSAVRSGAGIGLVPLYAVQREAALGTLARVLPEYFNEEEKLIASYPKGEFSSPWARLFVDFLQANLR